MKERSPSSWSATEVGASWAGGRGLAHAKAAGALLWRRSQNSGARPGGSCTGRLGPAVVLDRLMSGPRKGRGRLGLRAAAHCAGVHTVWGPRHLPVHCMQARGQRQKQAGRRMGDRKRCRVLVPQVRDPEVGGGI